MRPLILILTALLPLTAGAIPLPDLPPEFWPEYLRPAASTLGTYEHCRDSVNAVPVSSRTVAPDRYHLLRALCQISRSDPLTADERNSVLEDLSVALSVRGADTSALVIKGLLLQEAHDPAHAKEALEDALWFGRTKGYSEAFISTSLASVYAELNVPAKASELWARALGSSPENLAARLSLIELAKSQGNSARARTLVETGLQLHPDVADLQVAMAELLIGDTDRTSSSVPLSRARTLSQAAIKSLEAAGTTNSALLYRAEATSIQALIEGGNLADARAELKAAQKKHPGVDTFASLAEQLSVEEAAMRAGQKQEADGTSALPGER